MIKAFWRSTIIRSRTIRHRRVAIRRSPSTGILRSVAIRAWGLKISPGWFAELAAMDKPLRQQFQLPTLLTGSCPTVLKTIRIEHIDFKRRVLQIPKPKSARKKHLISQCRERSCSALFVRSGSANRRIRCSQNIGCFQPTALPGTSMSPKKAEVSFRNGK